IRGGSFNIVFLDEFAFVPNNIANEFFNSVYPVISSGKSSKIIIVSTPNGMNLFYKLWMDSIEGRNGYKPFQIHWSMVPGRDEEWKQETIRNTSERQFAQEFETEFLGSSNTLISGYKLQQLRYINPIAEHDKMKIYEQPIKEGPEHKSDHLYCICVDVSEGKNLDSSAFSIIDISSTPYKQVATYSSSSISPILFPTVIYNAAKLYNDAYVLVEINNNPQVADILHQDLEYENLLKIFTGNKKPQQLSAGFARGVQMGLKMSPQVKQIGCSNLKTLIEGDKLLINDFDTYSELTTFEQYKTSFAAADGANDDNVMTLVIFAWAATQKYFREIVNHDLRKQIQLENMNQIDEEVLPEPIIDDGIKPDFMIEGGDVWEVTNGGDTYASYSAKWFKDL
ncbi:terminase, partial [bacterium]|nr:terminase [Candidatus Elulimicrobium humile]